MSYSKRSRYSRSPSPYRRYSRSVSRSRSLSRSRSPSGDVENPGNNLYVTGLSPRITKRELEKHFSTEGKVIDVHLVVDPWTRESRGFGFVTMASLEEANGCIKNLDRSVLEGRVITVEKARRCRGRTPTPGRYLGLRTIRVRRRSRSYSPSRRSPSYSPYRRSLSGTDHTLDLVPLTVGLQMTATIEGATVSTEEGNDPTLHMTLGMMIATIEGEIDPTLRMRLGAQGGAILVASHPSEGESQDEAIPTVFLPDQEAQGEATVGACPRDQVKVSHMEEVRPSEQTHVRVTQGVHLGVGVQVLDPRLDQ
uniref:Serine/arginine-rich protein RS2Z32 n=1 Tax=Dimocarpus longan TaxID=128017 RepID=A0A7S6AKL3_9ROSI|nr:serine/arginine-rich protein RS2Z32 [Dimocarpus longan]